MFTTPPPPRRPRWPSWPPLVALALLSASCKGEGPDEPDPRGNNLPVIVSVTLSPDPAYAASELTATVVSADLDGDEVTLGYTWRLDGDELDADGPTLPARSAIRDQTLSVEVTIRDLYGFGAPMSASIVLSNSAPALTKVSIDPAAPQLGDALTCVATGGDDDGDALTWTYSWSIDGVLRTGQPPTLDEALPRNTAVFCEAQTSDGELSSALVRSETVYIGNAPPSAPGIALVPDPPSACRGGGVTVVTPSVDPDGDSLTYETEWTHESGAVVCSDTTCGGGVFSAGESYTVAVNAFDGFLRSTPSTITFTANQGAEVFGNDIDDDCDGLTDEWVTRAWESQQHAHGATAAGELGTTLAAGDVDGDSLDDLLVGDANGGVSIWRGRSLSPGQAVLGAADWSLTGATSPSSMALGDLDGDGLSDLVIGALGYDGAAGQDSGAALVVYGADMGSGDLAARSTLRVEGNTKSQRFGEAVAIGDLDGDGYAELALGDPNVDAPAREAGAVYLFSGASIGVGALTVSDADAKLEGGVRSSRLGAAVVFIPDLSGDGLIELVAGAYDADGADTDGGRVGVWFGGGALPTGYLSAADVVIDGALTETRLGREPGAAGDLDGDGLAELALGGEASGDVLNPGTIFLFSGAMLSAGGGFTTDDAFVSVEAITDDAALGLYGGALTLTDADGDGLADLYVGAGGAGTIHWWNAETLAMGGALTTDDADLTISAQAAEDRFGRWTVAGDTDGDGLVELITTAARDETLAERGGALYVFRPPWAGGGDGWEPDCDDGGTDGELLLCRAARTWDEAAAFCATLGRGLALPENASDNARWAALAAGAWPAMTSRGQWWIGLTDAAAEGDWRDVSGVAPGFTAWDSSAPSDDMSKNCAAINGPSEGGWRDLACDDATFFMCGPE
ncbi:FG-GAP-like repeat-containing protein [Myxococcota bacterium]|nr:FG-GAP-like repeat-containing protein [Myxococcota bacterium]